MNEASPLYLVAKSLPWESPTSWLSRVALGQGVTVGALLDYLGIDGTGDVDLNIIRAEKSRLMKLCGDSQGHLWLSRRLLGRLLQSGANTQRFLMCATQTGKPRYRFCPLCFREQRTPHLPIHWRFMGFRYCNLHHCMLEEKCPDCRGWLTMPVSQINAGRDGKGVAYLKQCMTCSADLSKTDALTTHQTFSLLGQLEMIMLRNGVAVLAALYAGHLFNQDPERPLPLTMLQRIDKQNLLPHQSDWLPMGMLRARLAQRLARHAAEREADIARLRSEGWDHSREI